MNIKDFQNELIKRLNAELPNEMGWEVTAECGTHVNQKNTELIKIKDNRHKLNRLVELKALFDSYNDGMSIESIIDSITNTVTGCFDDAVDLLYDFSYVKDKVLVKLVNAPKNRKILKMLPHKKFEDLAAIFYIVVSCAGDVDSVVTISDEMFEYWDITEDELFDIAIRNTAKYYPPHADLVDNVLGIHFDDPSERVVDMYVVQGGNKFPNGAVYMVCKQVMAQLADKLDDDLCIIPSSKQEILVCAKSSVEPQIVNKTILDVNEHLDEKLFLSNHAYEFDRKTMKIESVY